MAKTFFGELTLGAGINPITVSGGSVDTTLQAHPSNTGILYVRDSGTTGLGYPLAAGATIKLVYPNLSDYTVSGLVGQRLAWAASR